MRIIPWYKHFHNFKRNALHVLTGLIVAYVRNYFQHSTMFSSFFTFIGYWLIHYLAILLFTAICYGIIKGAEKYFFGYKDISNEGMSVDEALIYIPMVILIVSISIFFLAHWPVGNDYIDEY